MRPNVQLHNAPTFDMLFEQGLKSKEGNAQYSLAGSHLTGDERAL
jgi:hypothetical protein